MSVTGESLRRFLLRWSGVAVFLAAWEVAPRLDWIDPYFVPPFSTVLREAGVMFRDGTLGMHLVVSLWRAVAGLLTAILIGMPVGFLLGRRLVGVEQALRPILTVLSQVNPFSLLPVFLLFFGIGETAKVAVVSWVSLWPVMSFTITATRNVDPAQIRTALSMGISRLDLYCKVVLPAALPTIFTGMRVGAGLTFLILVAAEMLGSSAGLGYLVHNSAMNYLIPRIYAGATFIVVLGFLLNRLLLHVERRLSGVWEAGAFVTGPAGPAGAARLPGPAVSVAALGAVLIFIVFGGLEVSRINREAASYPSEALKHFGHIGQPVDR